MQMDTTSPPLSPRHDGISIGLLRDLIDAAAVHGDKAVVTQAKRALRGDRLALADCQNWLQELLGDDGDLRYDLVETEDGCFDFEQYEAGACSKCGDWVADCDLDVLNRCARCSR